jgi:hypothetical protein
VFLGKSVIFHFKCAVRSAPLTSLAKSLFLGDKVADVSGLSTLNGLG